MRDKKVNNQFIKQLRLDGKEPVEIWDGFKKKKVKCSLQTVLNRLSKMKLRGEISDTVIATTKRSISCEK